MRASRQNLTDAVRKLAVAAVAVAALCGLIGAAAFPTVAQPADQAPASPDAPALFDPDPPGPPPAPPPGPLKILSWNVASSPYAIAMRKIKSTPPSWRTSFGSERRTIEAPPPPQADLIDADVVLLQGITNPRALRRLFPARRWRLIFSRRALETLPKGSVFTAPVSSVEVEAVAIRFRDGLRITNRAEAIDDPLPAGPVVPTPVASPALPLARPPAAPGLAVKVMDRGRTLWFASVTLDQTCQGAGAGCETTMLLQRWRTARRDVGEDVVTGGRLQADPDTAACDRQTIEADAPSSKGLTRPAKGENRPVLGCVAELSLK